MFAPTDSASCGMPVTVTGFEKVTVASIFSPSLYVESAIGLETSAIDDTTAAVATRTVTLSVAVRLVPLAVTVSSYPSSDASVSAGAVKVGSWTFRADRSTVVPVALRHE